MKIERVNRFKEELKQLKEELDVLRTIDKLQATAEFKTLIEFIKRDNKDKLNILETSENEESREKASKHLLEVATTLRIINTKPNISNLEEDIIELRQAIKE